MDRERDGRWKKGRIEEAKKVIVGRNGWKGQKGNYNKRGIEGFG